MVQIEAIKFIKCEFCEYSTKRAYDLKRHHYGKHKGVISNNIYVPNEDNNIEFYLSNVGRSNPENQLRIAVRYHINKNNWRNFYKIGDDGILYPIEEGPNIPTKEKRIYEAKSKLDNIIETFFDTGKFVI